MRRDLRPTRSLLLMIALALAACGGGGSADAGDAESTTDGVTSDAMAAEESTIGEARGAEAADGRTFGTANSFSLRATGGVNPEVELDASEISLTGGCDGSTPISLGFRVGMPNEAGYFSFAFDTDEVVPTGATGTFSVEEIRWDDGIRTDTVSGGATVDIPNRWTGSGSLTLSTHTATPSARRMIGTVTGEVRGKQADGPAEITVEFDVNMSCGVG